MERCYGSSLQSNQWAKHDGRSCSHTMHLARLNLWLTDYPIQSIPPTSIEMIEHSPVHEMAARSVSRPSVLDWRELLMYGLPHTRGADEIKVLSIRFPGEEDERWYHRGVLFRLPLLLPLNTSSSPPYVGVEVRWHNRSKKSIAAWRDTTIHSWESSKWVHKIIRWAFGGFCPHSHWGVHLFKAMQSMASCALLMHAPWLLLLPQLSKTLLIRHLFWWSYCWDILYD